MVLPVILALTVIGAVRSGHVISDSSLLPQSLIDQLLKSSGQSLYYHDVGVVVATIVVGWLLWLSLSIT